MYNIPVLDTVRVTLRYPKALVNYPFGHLIDVRSLSRSGSSAILEKILYSCKFYLRYTRNVTFVSRCKVYMNGT